MNAVFYLISAVVFVVSTVVSVLLILESAETGHVVIAVFLSASGLVWMLGTLSDSIVDSLTSKPMADAKVGEEEKMPSWSPVDE
jgi:hypothetical protein